MNEILEGFQAVAVAQIVSLTLYVSLSATAIATLLGLPLGAWLAVAPRSVRAIATPLLNALMGLPPVVVGLLVYVALSRQGPLGSLGLLFTPSAMIVAQALLVLPIVAALACNHLDSFLTENGDQLRSLGARGWRLLGTALTECRFSLVTVVLAGAGRAFAEVGTVMIVGGNIDGFTRVITTTVATETSKGNIWLALVLGGMLVGIVIALNVCAALVRRHAARRFDL